MSERPVLTARGFDPRIAQVLQEVATRVVGKEDATLAIVCAVLAGGHILIEDVPGVGKTLLAKSVAQALDLRFHRVQATSDLLPADVVGVHIYDPEQRSFAFRPGPVFAELLLVDELNRASPRAQSALLEAMEEGQATVEGHSYPLPEPFTVLATQNPAEHEGTFPLPLSQLDRFLFRIRLDYPSAEEEDRLLAMMASEIRPRPLRPVLAKGEILELRQAALATHVSAAVRGYVQGLVRATRVHPDAVLGASPRAGVGLLRAARVWAFLHGRAHVLPDDVRALAPWVLGHRLRCRSGSPESCLREILTSLPLPRSTQP